MLRLVTKSKAASAVVRSIVPRALSTSAVAASSSAVPSVKDVTVHLTFVDPSGARRKVPGLVGKCSGMLIGLSLLTM